MRKLALSLLVLAGIALGGAAPASANATAGLASKPAVSSEAIVDKVGWGHRRHHGGLYFGFGYPAYYGYNSYNRYRYYDDDYSYRPRYYHRRHRHLNFFRFHHRRHHAW
jgi:hypothetical protein